MLLDKINTPGDLKGLSKSDLGDLCKEIRKVLIDTVMKNGGHLASNLGVVELTLAMHLAFDSPKDKFVFDVGHQSYVHKLLTGRYDKFHTLRQLGGISGFPNPNESEYDSFVSGHASTSVSAALGMARARDIKGEDYHVVALIGDGSVGGGEAFEALNDAGNSRTKLIVILNDNEMSIGKNVGGLSRHLTKLRTSKRYMETKSDLSNFLKKFGKAGDSVISALSTAKEKIKYSSMTGVYFEELGFTYLGPVDGHNLEEVTETLKRAKNLDEPVLVHVLTKKGYGYKEAEIKPEAFHGVSSITAKKPTGKSYSQAVGEILYKEMSNNKNMAVITAAMSSGCGLKSVENDYPDRFFDVGIAEQHATTLCAGLASGGVVPVFCVYSTFLQRAYDQLIHDVCLQNLHCVFLIDRAGAVGNDGATHQGVFDLSYLTHIPNMTVLCPSDISELEGMIKYAVNDMSTPVAIRYPRGEVSLSVSEKFDISKAEVIKEGKDIAIISVGNMKEVSLACAQELEKDNISTAVINLRCVKPFDEETVRKYVSECRMAVTIEDNVISGGAGSFIAQRIPANYLHIGWPDEFIPHGKVSELMEKYQLDKESIVQKIKSQI